MRDPSSIALGIVMPVILILLFGYALSLDVKNAPIALVIEQPSAMASEVAAGFRLSPYFDAQTVTSMAEAETLMRAHEVDGIVHLRDDFARKAAAGNAEVQVLLHGTDANTARIIQGYAQGAIGMAGAAARGGGQPGRRQRPGHACKSRIWFNEANDSHYFLVPGLIVLIMTLIGAFLTALVMAREWERGTLEAIFVTPVRATEILLGKIVPYFGLGMIGFTLCVRGGRGAVPRAAARLALRADRRVDALSAGLGRHRPVHLVGDQEPVRRLADRAARLLPAGDAALRLPVRHPLDAGRRCRSSPTSCPPAISSRCCRRSSWPATSGPSSCPTRPCWR